MKLLPKDFSAIIIIVKLKVGIGSKSAIKSLKSFGRGIHRAYIAAKDLYTFIINNKVSQIMILFISVCRMSELSSSEMTRGTSTKTDSSVLSCKAIVIASKVGSCLHQRLKINNAIQTFGEVFCFDPVGSRQMFMVSGGTVTIPAMLGNIGEVFIVISAMADNIASKDDFSLERRPINYNVFQIFGLVFCSALVGHEQFVLVLVWIRTVDSLTLVETRPYMLYTKVRHEVVGRTETVTDKQDAPNQRMDTNIGIKKLLHMVTREGEVKCVKPKIR